MYNYHQRHGFSVMMLHELFGLLQFPFAVAVLLGLMHCVDYALLFNDVPHPDNHTKTTISDVVLPVAQCVSNFDAITWIVVIPLSCLYWVFKLVKFLYYIVQYWDIKSFFNSALKIDDVSIIETVSTASHNDFSLYSQSSITSPGMKYRSACDKFKASSKCASTRKTSRSLTYTIAYFASRTTWLR